MANGNTDEKNPKGLPDGLLEELQSLLESFPSSGPPEELLESMLERIADLSNSELKQDGLTKKLQTNLLRLLEQRAEDQPKEQTLEELQNLLQEFRNLEKENSISERQINDEAATKEEEMFDKFKGMPKEFPLPQGSPLSDADDGWRKATFISEEAEELIELGRKIAEKFKEHFKPEVSQQRANDVEELFHEHVASPQTIEMLTVELQQEAFIEQISQYDRERDQALATAYNEFEKVYFECRNKVNQANADWLLAVRMYESETRNAWRTLKARLNKSPMEKSKSAEQCNDVYQEVKHYKRSSAISEALLNYEQARNPATSALATAYGELVNQLCESGNDAAVGEATLIQAEQSASETFWTNVQNALDNPSS
jgi:hypothetical protein